MDCAEVWVNPANLYLFKMVQMIQSQPSFFDIHSSETKIDPALTQTNKTIIFATPN